MKTSKLAVALVLSFAGIAAAQQNTKAPAPEKKPRFDVAISGAAVFSKTVSSSSGAITDSPTNAGAVFGSVRYHFNGLNAIEVNLGHFRNSQIFTVPPDTYRVTTDVYEFSGAYVLTPFQSKKWQPFLYAGGGGLRFVPGATYIDTVQGFFGEKTETSLAFLYGGGTDYRIWRRIALRVQYRGLVYRNPDFSVPSRFFTGARGHLAEPAFGIVAKF